MVNGKVWDSSHKIKYCKTPECQEIITMIGYDSQGYINAIQYCPRCAKARHKASKAASSRRKREYNKARNAYIREQNRLHEAQEIQYLREQAAQLRADAARALRQKTIEQEQAAEIRRLKREIETLRHLDSMGLAAWDFNRAYEKMQAEQKHQDEDDK